MCRFLAVMAYSSQFQQSSMSLDMFLAQKHMTAAESCDLALCLAHVIKCLHADSLATGSFTANSVFVHENRVNLILIEYLYLFSLELKVTLR